LKPGASHPRPPHAGPGDGFRIESALGDLHLKDGKVTDHPKQFGTVDVVLFAVKLWDTEAAGEQTRALVGSNTRVITLQNGVDSVERLAPILGDDAPIRREDCKTWDSVETAAQDFGIYVALH
jgi:ketopantoate reductase